MLMSWGGWYAAKVLLLKNIREAQDMPMALGKDRAPETAAPDAYIFVKSMAQRRSKADTSPGSKTGATLENSA
jgi:hypothetical protein